MVALEQSGSLERIVPETLSAGLPKPAEGERGPFLGPEAQELQGEEKYLVGHCTHTLKPLNTG